MRNLYLFTSLMFLTLSFAQNVAELDKKAGYMNIKIGSPLSSLEGNVVEYGTAEGRYAIKNISKYVIENHNIDRITIKVTKDGKEIIEEVSLIFMNQRNKLMKRVNDYSQGLSVRQEAEQKLQTLNAKSSEFFFYKKLFEQAFGSSQKSNDTDIWEGKKVTLSATYTDNVDGICTFSSNKSLSTPKNFDPTEVQEALQKF